MPIYRGNFNRFPGLLAAKIYARVRWSSFRVHSIFSRSDTFLNWIYLNSSGCKWTPGARTVSTQRLNPCGLGCVVISFRTVLSQIGPVRIAFQNGQVAAPDRSIVDTSRYYPPRAAGSCAIIRDLDRQIVKCLTWVIYLLILLTC